MAVKQVVVLLLLLVASLARAEAASAAETSSVADCERFMRPEARQLCLYFASAMLEGAREIRSPARAKPADLLVGGGSSRNQFELFNRLLQSNAGDEDLASVERPFWGSRMSDEVSLGRFQPMRGKRSLVGQTPSRA